MKNNTGLEVPFLWPLSLPLTTAGPWAESRHNGEEAPGHGVHCDHWNRRALSVGLVSLCQHPSGDLVSGELRSPLVKIRSPGQPTESPSCSANAGAKGSEEATRKGTQSRVRPEVPSISFAVPSFGISKQCCSIQPGNSLERERTRPTRSGLCSLRSRDGAAQICSLTWAASCRSQISGPVGEKKAPLDRIDCTPPPSFPGSFLHSSTLGGPWDIMYPAWIKVDLGSPSIGPNADVSAPS